MGTRKSHAVVPASPTPGLLVSMCMRDDHAFAAPLQEWGAFRFGLTDEQREERVAAMRAAYSMVAATGEDVGPGLVRLPLRPTDDALAAICAALGHSLESGARQVYEEIVGEGFYSPEREASYARVVRAAAAGPAGG